MSVPVGSVIPYLGVADGLNNLAGQGWLVCDGRSLATTDYPALNQAIGSAYGSVGAGYFNLPQLAGMFLRGVDPNGKVDPDRASRTSPDPSRQPGGWSDRRQPATAATAEPCAYVGPEFRANHGWRQQHQRAAGTRQPEGRGHGPAADDEPRRRRQRNAAFERLCLLPDFRGTVGPLDSPAKLARFHGTHGYCHRKPVATS